LLAESALLAGAAALVGVVLTGVGTRLLRTFGGAYFPRMAEVGVDGPVLSLLAALAAASVALFGLIPAVHGSGGPVDDSLRSSGRSSTGSVSVRRLRRVLVGSQFAIATPLLVVAGLLLASLNELGRVDLGFESHHVLTGRVFLAPAQYSEPARAAFWDRLERRVKSLPGVVGVTFADGRPPNDVNMINNFDLEDSPTPPARSQPIAPWIAVTPEYFRLLGLNLLQGRLLDMRDGLTTNVEAVVVDRAWAARFFPNGGAVGRRLKEGGCTRCPWTSVVGVVSDVKYVGLDKPDQGTVYAALRPQSQFRYLVLRTSSDPSALVSTVRQVVRDLDPSLPFSNVATIDELVTQSLQRPRSLSLLVTALAGVALVLSIVGIYGVMAYYVQQHAKDIGIRRALGGSSTDLLRLIVGQGMKVVAAGVLVGVLTALGLTRLMSGLLFRVGAADALTFSAVSALLLMTALLACVLPARRAIGVQPAVVLRND
jgi:putative ABC transport system permease protein